MIGTNQDIPAGKTNRPFGAPAVNGTVKRPSVEQKYGGDR